MGIALAALLGQIGLPGGGFGHGYGSMADVGAPRCPYPLPTFDQGRNPVSHLHPGRADHRTCSRTRAARSTTTGASCRLPDIRLVYWAGGNPFHHHQDLNRLRRAFARPDTIVVHEPFWTGTARHADIVLPTTTSLERDDVGGGRNDGYVIAMPRAIEPYGRGPRRLRGASPSWPSGSTRGTSSPRAARPATGSSTSTRASVNGAPAATLDVPAFDEFWAAGEARLPITSDDHSLFDRFRADPDGRKLPTPSGRIELFSETIDGVRLRRLPGPSRVARARASGSARRRAEQFPLHLIANQPSPRLHGQLDVGGAQPGVEGRRPRADPHPPRRRRGPRASPTATSSACSPTGGRAWPARSSPTRSGRGSSTCRPARGTTRSTRTAGLAVRPRQPERAHHRPRHVPAGAGVHRPARARRGRAVRGRPPAGEGAPAAACFVVR